MIYRTYTTTLSLSLASISLSLIGFLASTPVHANSIGAGVNDIAGTIGLKDSQGGIEGAKSRTAEILKTVISYIGILFLIAMLYGGFMWMTASGSEDRVKKAKEIILAGVVGLLIIVFTYAIVSLVFKTIQDAQKGMGGVVYAEKGDLCGPDNAGIECNPNAWPPITCRKIPPFIGRYQCAE